MKRVLKWVGMAALFAIGLLAVMVLTRMPSNDRDWIEMHARLPRVDISGDRVEVTNVRAFSYSGPDTVAAAHYRDEVYDIARLESVWYGVSHFGARGVAHPLMSFRFDDGRTLALSIEARLEKGESYNPIKGMMRNYEVIHVLGTDRDIIGLRSHWRDEPVVLYRLVLTKRAMRILFRALMEDVEALAKHPRFYNTLFDNSLSGLLSHLDGLGFFERWTDYRAWLPGHSAELAYEKGLLDTSVTLGELRERGWIDPLLVGIDDPAFSARIRGL